MNHGHTRLLLLILATGLTLPGCMARMAGDALRSMAHKLNEHGRSAYVHRPDLLRGIERVSIPEFKVYSLPDSSKVMKMYPGTALSGQVNVASRHSAPLFREVFESALLRSPTIRVTERNRLERVLSERQMEQTGVTDKPANPDAMQTAGVDGILFGTVSNAMAYMPDDPVIPMFVSLGIRVTLIDVRSGAIVMIAVLRYMLAAPMANDEILLEAAAADFADLFTKAKARAATADSPFTLDGPNAGNEAMDKLNRLTSDW